MEVGRVLGAEAWSELADQVVAVGSPTVSAALVRAMVDLGLTGADRQELAELVRGRVDPAGQLLARVVASARTATDAPYAVPLTPTDVQMDRALAAARQLRTGAPADIATRLVARATLGLDALPPDAAGGLVVALLEDVGRLPDPGGRLAALAALDDLCATLPLARVPVAALLAAAVALARDGEPALRTLGHLLGRLPTERLLSGCTEAMRRTADADTLASLLTATATATAAAAARPAGGRAAPPPIAPPVPAPSGPAPPGPTPPGPAPQWAPWTPPSTAGLPPPSGPPARPAPTRGSWLRRWRGGHQQPQRPGQQQQELAPPPAATRTAYPRIDVDSHQARPEVVVIDAPFDVTVGLARRKDAELTQTGAMTFAAGVPVKLELVLVYDPSSLVPQGNTRLTLSVTDADPYPTAVVTFVAQYGEDLPPERRIGVHFLRDGQLVGIAWRSIIAVDDPADVAGAPVPDTRESTLLDLAPLLGADLPDLILSVCRADGSGTGRFVWTAYPGASGVGVPDAPRTAELDGDLAGFVVEMRRAIQFSKGGSDDYLELAGRARRIGRAIPAGIRAAIQTVVADPARTTAPSILLLTEELSLPWELAALDPPLDTAWGGFSPFLGAHAAIGRWPLSEHKPRPTPRTSVTVRRAAVLTADYTGVANWGKLDHAITEAADVAGLFAPPAVTVRPSVWDVVDLLRGTPPADVVHVALHGQFDAQGAQEGLVLLGTDAAGALTTQWRFLTSAEVENGDLASGPFVFLNACQVASDKRVLGDYGGFASTLLRIGAAGVVAPLWNVDDDVAATIARDFYAATWTAHGADAAAPVSAAEAVRAVRATYTEAAVRAETPGITATLVAFQVFGHPRLHLTTST